MYDRKIGDKTLSFEASGALWQASLVMRDRETDSWWSIMTSDSIGGPLEEKDLVELPISEKTTWGDWKKRHPKTLVLSVEGVEHIENNPYDNYFEGDRTFRGMEVEDQRLEPKAAIFSFWLDAKPWAAPHAAFEGGKVFRSKELGERALLLYRPPGASIFASTRAYLVRGEVPAETEAVDLLPEPGQPLPKSLAPLTGFDTFWYNWVAIQKETKLLR